LPAPSRLAARPRRISPHAWLRYGRVPLQPTAASSPPPPPPPPSPTPPAPAPQRAEMAREDIGVELYGAQQQLASLQEALERHNAQATSLAAERARAEAAVDMLRRDADARGGLVAEEERRLQSAQRELQRLQDVVRRTEAHTAEVRGEIAVQRRVAYAAEEGARRLEKDREAQDLRIDRLSERVRARHEELSALSAQVEAQRAETVAARGALEGASGEMERVRLEQKGVAGQWKVALAAVAKRDAALAAVRQAIDAEREAEAAAQSETRGVRREALAEQQRNETLATLLRKIRADGATLQAKLEAADAAQRAAAEQLATLSSALETLTAELDEDEKEGRRLQRDVLEMDRAVVRAAQAAAELDQRLLSKLAEESTLEKGAAKAIAATRVTAEKTRDEELSCLKLQNELARVEVDILHTERHVEGLARTTQQLDEELRRQAMTIDRYHGEIRRRNDEIDKKTKSIDVLNRQFERLAAAHGGDDEESMGPLEATVRALQSEIAAKAVEGKVLQRRWIGFQTQLVEAQAGNQALEERVARQKAEGTVVRERKRRTEAQHAGLTKDIAELDRQLQRLRHDAERVNEIISRLRQQHVRLADECASLDRDVAAELGDLDGKAAATEARIARSREEKRALIAEVIEAERLVGLWQRKLALAEEMRKALDPTVGNEVVAAMTKEVHRMRLRLGELGRSQEALVKQLERGVAKRGQLGDRGRALAAKAGAEAARRGKASGPGAAPPGARGLEGTAAGEARAMADLQRGLRETEREALAADARMAELEEARAALAGEAERAQARGHALRQEEADLREEVARLTSERTRALVTTAATQRLARRFEAAAAARGSGGGATSSASAGGGGAAETHERVEAVRRTIEAAKAAAPELGEALDRVALSLAVTT